MHLGLVGEFNENVPRINQCRPEGETAHSDPPKVGEGARFGRNQPVALAEFEKLAGGISEHRGLLLDTRRGLTRNSDKNPSGHFEIDDKFMPCNPSLEYGAAGVFEFRIGFREFQLLPIPSEGEEPSMWEGGPTGLKEDRQNERKGPMRIRGGFEGGAAKLLSEGGPEVRVNVSSKC